MSIFGFGNKTQSNQSSNTTITQSSANNFGSGSANSAFTLQGNVTGSTFTMTDDGAVKQAFDLAHSAIDANGNAAGQVIAAAGSALQDATNAVSAAATPPGAFDTAAMVKIVLIIGVCFVAYRIAKK